jgi:prolyl oligopeptidase
VRPEDGVTGYVLHGDYLFIKTHQDAPRYQIKRIDLRHPEPQQPQVMIPASDYVIQAMRIAGKYLISLDLHAGLGRLRRMPLEGGRIEPIRLPFEGSITEWGGDPGEDQFLFQMTSWTRSPLIYRCDTSRNTTSNTGWREAYPIDFSSILSMEVHAPSKDGTLIPLSIIYKRGLALDGNNPCLMVGYGSYGMSYEPAFSPSLLAWYERGGIYAVAHVRGGGEYGKEWHTAGQKLNKQNSIDDFIACGEYLIEHGYTRPELLAGSGTSAGGITAGVALAQQPDLFGAMILRVADTNALRSEFMESGPANVPEFGSVTTEEGFRSLLLMDAYHQIADGTAYPPVLITTGTNDPRVAPWQGMKMAARLQAASRSPHPVLLRVDFAAGHGIGSTKQQRDAELADQLIFLLSVLKPPSQP